MIALLAGVVLFQQQATLPDRSLLWGLAALALAALPFVSRSLVARLTLAFLGGFLWSGWHAALLLQQQLPQESEGRDLEVSGWVASLPHRDEHRTRFNFEVESPTTLEGSPFPRKLALSWYKGAPELHPGERMQLVVRLKRPWGTLNPGGFDYEQWLLRQGIRATGYVRSGHSAGESWRYPLQRLRASLHARLSTQLAGEEMGGIVTALAMGERDGIARSEWNTFTATGTNHLVAVSGLHVGLVAGLLFLLGRRLWSLFPRLLLHLPAPRFAALLAFAGALLYAALAGFSVPTQRALMMTALVLAAIGLKGRLATSQPLAVALVVLLLIDPLAVLEAGFWLSFGAVALLLYAMQGRLAANRGWWWRWGRVHWVAAFGLLPLMVLFFHQTSLTAPLANALAVPWVGLVVVPLSLLGTLLAPLSPLVGGWLLHLACAALALLWPLLEWLAQWQPALGLGIATWWSLPLATIAILWWLAPRGWPARWAAPLLLLPLLLVRPERPAPGEFWFTLFDVGQGLAAVVETEQHTLIFDTGLAFNAGNDSGGSVLLPFLRQRGNMSVDTLVVSHGDSDHIGGMETLLAQARVGRLLTSVPDKMGDHPFELCAAGQQWQWDGINFQVLHPQRGTLQGHSGRGNDDSCVLRVSNGRFSLLLTGDIEAPAERELLARYGEAGLRAQLLVAPHHGSKSSSTPPFIAAVAPHWVLFPVGYRNRYRFPAASVVGRYREAGSTLLDTASSGAIMLRTDAVEGPRFAEYRKVRQRYWHSAPLH